MNGKTVLLGMGAIAALWIFAMAAIYTGQGTISQGGSAADIVQGSAVDVYLHANSNGTYDKEQITLEVGVPVRLHFSAASNAGCGRGLVISGMNVNVVSQNGQEQIVEFTPGKTGVFEYNCPMRMWKSGKLVVA